MRKFFMYLIYALFIIASFYALRAFTTLMDGNGRWIFLGVAFLGEIIIFRRKKEDA